MLRAKFFSVDKKQNLLKQIKETLICRFEAEAELYDIEKREVGKYVDKKMLSVIGYDALSEEKLTQFLKNQVLELGIIERKIHEKNISYDSLDEEKPNDSGKKFTHF